MRRAALASLHLLLALGCSSSGGGGPAAAPDFSAAAFADPSAEYGPWARWWWPGGDVEEAELRREVALLARAGFGGAEVQPFDAALDPDAPADEIARRRSFDTPAYYDRLRAALDAARSEGLSIDLTFGSGWPTGGAHVGPEEALRTLLWTERTVEGPGAVVLDLGAPNRPFFYDLAALFELLAGERLARYEGERAELLEVVAARVTGGARSGNPLVFTDAVELDAASVEVLTDRVAPDGTLAWTAPPGRWQAVAVFVAPDGEYPTLNAQPEPGRVLDHLDRGAVEGQLARFLEAPGLAGFFGAPLRAVFSDSLELKADRLAARDMLDAFAARRGYGLAPWLPAVLVPGADNTIFDTASAKRGPEFRFSPEDARVRRDYGETLTDLYVERYAGAASAWLGARGMAFRAQSYGADLDVIRAQGAADIPEAEQLYAGGSELFLKTASSAAMLYGRPLVASESMVWLGRAYMDAPVKLKAAADKLLAAGVNRVVYHGLPYRKSGDAYPSETGWHPFASPFAGAPVASDVSEASPWWDRMPALNRYLARAQYAMRRGEPAADVLVYYPWLGFPTTLAGLAAYDEFLLNGAFEDEPEVSLASLLDILALLGLSETDPRAAWLAARAPMLEALTRAGYVWAWADDASLAEARAEGGEVAIRGKRYGAVLLAETEAISRGAAEALAEAASGGAAVVLAGAAPTKQTGLLDFAAGDAAVRAAMDAVRTSERGGETSEADVAQALADADALPALAIRAGGDTVRHARRELGGGARLFFLASQARDPGEIRVAVRGGCAAPTRADAWTGALSRLSPAPGGELAIPLEGYGSTFLLCGASVNATAETAETLARTIPLDAWTLAVTGDDVPGGAVLLDPAPLGDWRDAASLRFSGSTGVYRTSLALPALAPGERAVLSAAWVAGAARVRVNGREAGDLLLPPWEADVTDLLRDGANEIELALTPPLRNRLIGKALSGDPRYGHFGGTGESLVRAGVHGPLALHIRRPLHR